MMMNLQQKNLKNMFNLSISRLQGKKCYVPDHDLKTREEILINFKKKDNNYAFYICSPITR